MLVGRKPNAVADLGQIMRDAWMPWQGTTGSMETSFRLKVLLLFAFLLIA